jgi:hypothetical protein
MRSDAAEIRELTEAEAESVSGGIIIVGGLDAGSSVMLNPQPLPPVESAFDLHPDLQLVSKQFTFSF